MRRLYPVVVLVVIVMITSALIIDRYASNSNHQVPVGFRPRYLSNVSMNVQFSNEGPELLVTSPEGLKRINGNVEGPVLVVGEFNVTRLVDGMNLSTQVLPINVTPKAVVIYDGKIILMDSGEMTGFLRWVHRVIAHESHWELGIYSDHSGVLLSVQELSVKVREGNWSAVGGEVYKHQILLRVTVPGREEVEFSVVPINEKLLDYYPTTSKFSKLIIHDRSDFSVNLAGWIVENYGDRDVRLKAIIGTDSKDLTVRYILNGVTGELSIHGGIV